VRGAGGGGGGGGRDAHGIGPAVRLRFDVAAVTGARVEVREAAF
jgi:hypothetical protein